MDSSFTITSVSTPSTSALSASISLASTSRSASISPASISTAVASTQSTSSPFASTSSASIAPAITPSSSTPSALTPSDSSSSASTSPAIVSSSNDSSSGHVAIIIGFVAAGLVAALLLTSILVVLCRGLRRKRSVTHDVSIEKGRRFTDSSSDFGEHGTYRTHPSSDSVSMSGLLDSKPRSLYPRGEPQRYQATETKSLYDTGYRAVADNDGQGELQRHVEPPQFNAARFLRAPETPQEYPNPYITPLTIRPFSPTFHANYISTDPTTTIDNPGSGRSTPSSDDTDTDSMYSQTSAASHMHHLVARYSPPPPLPSLPLFLDPQAGPSVQRTDTTAVGHLLKSRVNRFPDAVPSRRDSRVSQIERSNSINSVRTTTEPTANSAPSHPRWLKRSLKTPRVPMEPLMESPRSAILNSFPGPSSSAALRTNVTADAEESSTRTTLTSAFRTSISSSSKSPPSISSEPLSRTTSSNLSHFHSSPPKPEFEFYTIDLNSPAPLRVVSKSDRQRERVKLNIQTQFSRSRALPLALNGRVQNSQPEGPRRVQLRDKIVTKVPDTRQQDRISPQSAVPVA